MSTTNARGNFFAVFPFGDLQIILRLEPHPDSGAGSEIAGQAHRGVGGDAALAANDLADSQGRHSEIFGDPVLTQSQGLHEIFEKNLSGMNLRTIYFRDSDLQNFNFHKSDLHEARFEEVGLQGVNFSQSNLQKAKMRGDLSGVNFSKADLRQASIRYSNLSQANLQKANLNGAMLVEVDLRHANLAQADLTGISFGNWVKINGANLEGVDLTNARIMNARGLTCEQLQQAIVRINTRLPKYLGDCGQ